MANVGALEFLLGEEGCLWIPTRCWAIPRPGGKPSDLDAWDLSLTEPSAPPSFLIEDLKGWMLFGAKPDRYFQLAPGSTSLGSRRIRREDALVRYLESVVERIPPARRGSLAVLTPSIRDDKARKRYHDTLRRVLPSARLLPEPEMILEYFRLVQRTLTLDPDRNNVILVIDIGASTSNATIVHSNRGGEVIGGEFQKQRDSRLRALSGTCGDKAGRWVDERLAQQAGILPSGLPFLERSRILRQIERAKIEVSRTGAPVLIERSSRNPYGLTPGDIKDVAKQVVGGLKPILAELRERLWKQQTGTEAARGLNASIFSERQVTGVETALQLVDVVLLAGGTSRLLGFREQLEPLFGNHKPRFLEVGESFAVAAAVGALAHICHAKYDPPRIHHCGSGDDAAPEPVLEGALNVDIQLAWKPRKPQPGETETRETVLERGDPIVYQGGAREDVMTLPVVAQAELKARLIPDIGIKSHKKGLSPHNISPQRDNPKLGFQIDNDRNMVMTSSMVAGINGIRIDLKRFDVIEELAPQRASGEIPAGQLSFDAADDVVLDFGMSKTVAVAVHAGLLDPRELDREVARREDPAGAQRDPAPKLQSERHDLPPAGPPSATPASLTPPAAALPRVAPQPPPGTPDERTERSGDPPAAVTPVVPAPPAEEGASSDDASTDPASPLAVVDEPPVDSGAAAGPEPPQGVRAPVPDPAPAAPEPEEGAVAEGPAAPPPAHAQAPGHAAPVADPPVLPSAPSSGRESASAPRSSGHLPRTTEGFMPALREFLRAAERERVDVPKEDLMFTLLGLSVRPFLLLAGPPGCGKSTLARIVAHLLRRKPGHTFHEVPVQAHWVSDIPLFGHRGVLKRLCEDLENTHVVLFDEINLTRPEYYLSRMLHAVESPLQASPTGLRLAPTFCLGTLNIDDTSRAPSPKILDRCFLVEVDPVHHTHELRPGGSAVLPRLPTLPGLPDAWHSRHEELDPFLLNLIRKLEDTVRGGGLRQDLLPSRRVLGDLQKVTALHAELGGEARELLTRDELLDRLITNRILVKLAGPLDQVNGAIQCIATELRSESGRFPRALRRISLADQQRHLGFISPWQ